MIHSLLAIAALPFVASAQVSPAPIASSGRPPRVLLAWMPGEIRCGGAIVTATVMQRPWTNLIWANNAGLKPLNFGFDIDATGRPVSIRRIDGGYVPHSEDVAPSLVATRFAPGVARTGCTLAYLPRETTMADTPVADLVSYTVTPLSGPLPEDGWARIKGAGNCADAPRPQPLVQVLPDFRALPARPGVKDWALVGYDLDKNGRPRSVHVVHETGNKPLSVAAIKAMAESRFTGGAHKGCLYPYWRTPATLAAPIAPEPAAFRPAGATCPENHAWATQPTLHFPEPYRRRAIEGWAIIAYDVAPWGEIGNARVVAAQPSEDFGTQALNVIRNAKVPTTQGLVGCIDRVQFVMPASDGGKLG